MIKWIVKRHLNKKYKYLKFQILSLEQELGYADDNEIEPNEIQRLLIVHEDTVKSINALERILNKIV